MTHGTGSREWRSPEVAAEGVAVDRGVEEAASAHPTTSVRGFAKDWFLYGVVSVLGRVTGVVMLPVYTRYLTPDEYGIRSIVAISINALFLFLALGIPMGVLRFYRDEDQRERPEVVSTALLGVTLLGTAGVVIGWVIAEWLARVMFGGDGFAQYVRLGILGLGFGYILEVPLAYLQVTKRSQAFATVAVLRLVVGIALNVLFVIVLRTGVLGTLYAEILGNAAFCIVLAALTVARVGSSVSARLFRILIQYGAPSLVIAISSLVIANAGRLMLTRYGSLADVGLYALADQIAGVMLLVLVQPFTTAWGPAQFEMAAKPRESHMFAELFGLFASVLIVGGFALSVFAEEILRLAAAEAFWPAAAVVPVLVPCYILFGLHAPLNSGILISKRTVYWGAIMTVAALVNVALSLVLVPDYRVMGAAAGRLGSMMTIIVATYVIAQRIHPIEFAPGGPLRTFACAAVLFTLSMAIPADVPALSIPLKTALVVALIAAAPPIRLFVRAHLPGRMQAAFRRG